MKYDSKSKPDMHALAKAVAAMPAESQPAFGALILAADLIRSQWNLRAAVAVGCFIHKDSKFARWSMLIKKQPSVATQAIEGLARHIEFGRDTYEKDSAGGLSSKEVTIVANALEAMQAA